jgi:hypothetical protein
VEIATDPFEIPRAGVVRIDLSAEQIQEAWAAVDIALVQGDDSVTHIVDGELSYYDSDDDSPSEGSRTDTLFVRVDDPGTYHLLVRTMGGSGESEAPGDLPAPVRIRVTRDVATTGPFVWAIVFSTLMAIVLFGLGSWQLRRTARRDDDEGPESEP